MPIGTFGLIVIQLGLSLLSRLLAPRLPRRKSDPFELPTVEDGAPITVGFGIYRVPAHITLVRNAHKTEQGGADTTQVTRYFAKVQMAFGYGPVDVFYDLIADERSLSLAVASQSQSVDGLDPLVADPPLRGDGFYGIPLAGDDPLILDIAWRQAFGGQLEEGGMQGTSRIYRGTSAQQVDALLLEAFGDEASAYPWLCYIVFGTAVGGFSESQLDDDFYWTANSPTIKPVSALLGRYPNRLLGDDGRIGLAANWVEVIYECFRNEVWGKGEPEATFDVAQWQAQAANAKAGGEGMAGLFSDRPLDDIIDDIKSHFDAEVVQDPITGLIQLKVARNDYEPDDLLEVTHLNASEFQQGQAQYADTLNEIKVKYSRFDGGTPGDQTQTFTAHFLRAGPSLDRPPEGYMSWDAAAKNIVLTSATRDRAGDVQPLVGANMLTDPVNWSLIDFAYNSSTGEFWFHTVQGVSTLQEGDVITLTFTAAPTYTGFRDATATAQNLANRQIVGRLRSEAYDYPLYITEQQAQRRADLLRKTTGRRLDVFKWRMGRVGGHLTPLDVVKLNDPDAWGVTNRVVRITKITYGPLETDDVSFEGVEDVWGEDIHRGGGTGSVGSGPPIRATAPAMAGIWCAGEDQLGLQAGDTTFQIEIQRADDAAGTGATTVETVDGTTATWTDTTAGKYHRARQVRSDVDPGPWTTWLAPCTSGSPDCTPPTWDWSQLYDGNTGTLAGTITDNDHRISLIEVQVTDPDGVTSEWEPFDPQDDGSYQECVTVLENTTSYIRVRLTYTDCIGVVQTPVLEFPFTLPPQEEPPPPPVGLTELSQDIYLGPWARRNVNEDFAVSTPFRDGEVQFNLGGFKSGRLTATVVKAAPSGSGAYASLQFEAPGAPDTWDWVDDVDGQGPNIPLDKDVLALMDPGAAPDGPWVVAGPFVNFRLEALSDVRIRIGVHGGDGSEHVMGTRSSLQPSALAANGPEPEEPGEPPDFDPGSCDTPDPLDITAPDSQVEPPGAVWSDSGGIATLTLDGTGSGPATRTWIFTYGPNELRTFYIKVNPSVGIAAFGEVVGGDHVESVGTGDQILVVRGTTDGSGNITVNAGVEDIGTAPGGASSKNLDYADEAAAAADGVTVVHTAGTITFDSGYAIPGSGVGTSIKMTRPDVPGDCMVTIPFAVVSGQNYQVKVWARAIGPWYSPDSFSLASGANTGGASINPNADGSLTVRQLVANITAGAATLDVTLSAPQVSLFGATKEVYWAGLEVVGAAGGAVTIDFSDFGECLGSGLGTGGTGLGGGDDGTPGDDPIPDPPPGGYPPPVVGAARVFTASFLPETGLGYWNGTIMTITRLSAPNIYAKAHAAGSHVLIHFGGKTNMLSGGRFSYALWKALVDDVYNDPRAKAAVDAGLADGTFPFIYLIDEPMLASRWGYVIPFTVVQQMCMYLKSLWPTAGVAIRVAATNPWFTGHMNGLDFVWAQYILTRGDCKTFRDQNIAKAQAYGHGIVLGLNIGQFTGTGGRAITPSELDHYGTIMTTDGGVSVAFNMWRYQQPMYSQSGFVEPSLHRVRDNYAAQGA